MRAAVFRAIGEPLSIETLPEPVPGDGEVVIKVCRCGICGTDLHMSSHPAFAFAPGTAIGHEYSGEVVALGRDVRSLKVGDRITAMPMSGCGQCAACLAGHPYGCPKLTMMMGGCGEYTVVRESSAIRLPRSVSLADGALVEPLASCLHAVAAASMDAGARVLVLGAGAMGMGAVFWARRLGAGRVAVSARSSWREPLALKMGADAYLPSGEYLPERVASALGGPPDVVFECAGAPGLIEQAVNLVRPRGTAVIAGGCMEPDSFVPALAMFKEVRLQFACAYSLEDFQHSVDVLERGALEPTAMATQTVTLDALPEAFEALRQGSRQCKVMVDPFAIA